MRFSKILLVCFALVLFAGLSAHQVRATAGAGTLIKPVAAESAAGSAVLSAALFLADGGAPLPPPKAADGGAPLPPPVVADGGAPLPPPKRAAAMLAIQA